MQLLKDRIRKDGKVKRGKYLPEGRQFSESPNGYPAVPGDRKGIQAPL